MPLKSSSLTVQPAIKVARKKCGFCGATLDNNLQHPNKARRMDEEKTKAYWRANLKLIGGLLVLWFAVSFGAGILFVDLLNLIQIGGYKLGFWFAQQGSIYVFIILTFYYAHRMTILDKTFGVDEDD